MMAQHAHSINYDADTDVLTFDGYKFTGELMRTLTATPCGLSFRIIERKDGVISMSQERDPVAVAAPDMLAALREVVVSSWESDSEAIALARAAIAKAEAVS